MGNVCCTKDTTRQPLHTSSAPTESDPHEAMIDDGFGVAPCPLGKPSSYRPPPDAQLAEFTEVAEPSNPHRRK